MNISKLRVQKKNGTVFPYDASKIVEAANKSATRARGGNELYDFEAAKLVRLVQEDISKLGINDLITTQTLHSLVEKNLMFVDESISETYKNYHSFRMNQALELEKLFGKCTTIIDTNIAENDDVLTLRNQNANADASIASSMRSAFADFLGENYYETFFLTQEEKQLSADGYIYIHDKNGRSIYPLNCCLFDIGRVLKGESFFINGVGYSEPNSIDTAFDVIGDIVLSAASQQYGGFTLPEIDSVLAPYCEKSYEKYYNEYVELGVEEEKARITAEKKVKKEIEQGFQGWEYKFNTVASSRGDYPFTTISFGLNTSKWGRILSKSALKVRQEGQGKPGKKIPVLFPKLVFLFDENLHGEGKELEDVFLAGLECSSKTMYPDWLSLTGEGYVPSIYKKYGLAISPMGCRAFLSPYYERGGFEPADEDDKPVFVGRFNIGAISLHLPMILAKAREEERDFYIVLDEILEVVRNLHIRTKNELGKMKAARNPFGFMFGGFYKGNLKADDCIAPVLESATASFGVTALNELQMLYNGKSLVEDGQFTLEVMEHINNKITEFKNEDHILYAVYGTPAENLCGKQVKQFRAKYGIIKGVSDREYVSNSFHCHVTEKISPIEKQNLEKRFWDLFNGGKIQYVRYNLGYNINAIKSLILRAMEMGFYEGVNLSLDFCDDCGYRSVDFKECPRCGSNHIIEIDRMNGYLGFTITLGAETEVIDEDGNTKIVYMSKSRYSPHKLKEISERVSM